MEKGLEEKYDRRLELLRHFGKARLAGVATNVLADFGTSKVTKEVASKASELISPPGEGLNKTLGSFLSERYGDAVPNIPEQLSGLTAGGVGGSIVADVAGNQAGKHLGRLVAKKLAERDSEKLNELQGLTSELEPYIRKGHKHSVLKPLATALSFLGVPGTSALKDIVPSWTKKSEASKFKPIQPFKISKINQTESRDQGLIQDAMNKRNPQLAGQVSSVAKLKSSPKLPRNVRTQL